MKPSNDKGTGHSRRQFIKLATGVLGGGAIYAVLLNMRGSSVLEVDASPDSGGYDPAEHFWGFVVDVHKCIGCGRCVLACKLENNIPLRPTCNRTWVERYRIAVEGDVFVDSPDSGINGFVSATEQDATVEGKTIEKGFFVPKLCNQCDNPPCVQVCPVAATYRVEDGIVLIDQERCIGCRYCIQACPYGARYLIPPGATRSPRGITSVADKCTWCYQRITKGNRPACVEVCPVEARLFGDLLDPDSTVRRILREQRVTVLKPDLGTKPKVYYVGLEEGVR